MSLVEAISFDGRCISYVGISTMKHRSKLHAYTLIEVLVVMVIIGILIALILPAVQASREMARQSRCRGNLKQIGLALQQYASVHGTFPLGWGGSRTGHSFLVALLPSLEQQPLYDTINMQTGLSETLVTTSLSTFICPSDGLMRTNPLGKTNYAGNRGSGVQAYGYNGAFALDDPIGLQEFTDGLSHTAAVSEWLVGPNSGGIRMTERSVFSTGVPLAGKDQLNRFASSCRNLDPRTAPLTPAVIGVPWTHGDLGGSLYNHVVEIHGHSCLNGSLWQEGAWTAKSNHPEGVNVLFADGHVQFLKNSTDLPLWRALGSRDGGEIVGNGEP